MEKRQTQSLFNDPGEHVIEYEEYNMLECSFIIYFY